jgi:hypothetical protein
MTNRHEVISPKFTMVGCALLFFAACSSGSGGGATAGAQAGSTSGTSPGGSSASSGGSSVASSSSGGQVAGASTSSSQAGGTTTSSGQDGGTGSGGQTGSTVDGGLVSPCVGKEWTTADPTVAGPFKVATEKNVGPKAGALPDPIYGDKQQAFNIYRPDNLKDSGYCHPIMIWANGYKDNPEQNPPDCIVSSAENRWCGQYSPILIHLASHGFVVMASLSTTTATDPVPTTVGLEWLLKQAEDPNNTTYYHRLDIAHIGAYGHSMGGMSTCKSAGDPRYSAIATISGTGTINGLHTPALFFCGGKENNVCDNTQKVVDGIKTQPAMMVNNINADHGSWAYEGAKGVDISGMAAWFRLHLMGDTAQRKRFFGDGCTFCTDSRVKVYRNSLMTP